MRGGDGMIYCDCRGWKMSRLIPKTCTHLKQYGASSGNPAPAAPAAPAPKLATAKSVKVATGLPNEVDPSTFVSNNFQAQMFYQGCGDAIPGDTEAIAAELEVVEKGGKYVAEPKYDGIWIAAFSDGGKNRFWSRNRNEKPYGLDNMGLPAGTLLIGELGFGSEHALERRAKIGHDFMDVYGILYQDYKSQLGLDETDRRAILEKFHASLSGKLKEYFLLAPRFTKGFAKQLSLEHEGLVLKKAKGSDTAYQGKGLKVPHWRKAKKSFEADMVIMDINLSTAETKSSVPMVESLVCGQYVGGTLKSLVRVGSMSSAWSQEFASSFEQYKGKVITISHFGQFKSGALRHPAMKAGSGIRTDKDAKDCVFNPKER
jgi:ATP-dependent DNA ligase